MAEQLSFITEEITYEVPDILVCNYHGEYTREAYWTDDEVLQMLEEQGFIDCPMCLVGIVGVE